jgi:hypothetical protein
MKPRTRQRSDPTRLRLGVTVVCCGFAFLISGLAVLFVEIVVADILGWWLVLCGAAATGFGAVLIVRGD